MTEQQHGHLPGWKRIDHQRQQFDILGTVTQPRPLRLERPHQKRRRNHGCQQGHHHRHAEHLRREASTRQTDPRDDQRHLAARNHPQPNPQPPPPVETAQQRGQSAAEQLGQNRDNRVQHAEQEDLGVQELGDVHHHSHDREKERNQKGKNRIQRLPDHMADVGP